MGNFQNYKRQRDIKSQETEIIKIFLLCCICSEVIVQLDYLGYPCGTLIDRTHLGKDD